MRKMHESGMHRKFKTVLDLDEGSYIQDKETGLRTPLVLRGDSFFFKGKVIAAIGDHGEPEAANESTAQSSTVDTSTLVAGDSCSSSSGPSDPAQAAIALSPQLPNIEQGVIQNPIGIGPGSNVDVMKRRLKELEAPTYETKSQLYKRLQVYETKAKAEKLLIEDLRQ